MPGDADQLVSVIMTCSGQLEYSRLSVPRMLRFSRRPFEFLFIDVGSLDGTAEFLAGVAAAEPMPVAILRPRRETDLPGAYREAVKQARGESLVFLANDTLVTESWLDGLVTTANRLATIGMVGPMANYAPARQAVDGVPYRLGKAKEFNAWSDVANSIPVEAHKPVDDFARSWRSQHAGRWSEVEQLGGFCLLVKREVFQGADLIDPQSQRGYFEVDAWSERARQAGYLLACSEETFVHHFGTRRPALRSEARAAG